MPTHNQRKSRLQERRMAEDLGGRQQPASGARPHAKGDVRTVGETLGEAKTTSKKSYILKLSDLMKIQAEALQSGVEDPVLQIEFQGQFGMNKKYAVIDWNRYIELKETEKSFQRWMESESTG